MQFFKNKDGLYLAAMADVIRTGRALDRLLEDRGPGIGERLADFHLGLWEEPETRGPMQAVLMSAASHPPAAEMMRTFVSRELIGRVAAKAAPDRPELRAALCGSHVVGIAIVRYVVGVEPLSTMPRAELAGLIGPTIDACLLGPLPVSLVP